MQLLAVSSSLHSVHHNVLCSHERKLCHKVLLDDLGVDYKPVHHVQAQVQDAVNGQEASGTLRRLLAESSSVLSNH